MSETGAVMSRMLNVVREPAAARVLEPVVAEPVEIAEQTPFIEIGGPNGPVTSGLPPVGPKLASNPSPTPATKPAAVPEVVPFLRLAKADPSYVSVAFHGLTPAAKASPRGDGPSADLIALHFPEHPVSLEYRSLLGEIRQQLPDGVPHALMFTAAEVGAGTTTVALNLAITLATNSKARVLVLDANVARPSISARLNVKDTPGLAESLTGHLPLAWAIQGTVVPNLQVLAAGIATSDTPGAFAEELPKLLAQLRQWYDWVLIDAGVWGEIPERDAACPGADAVYLVTREANASRTEFEGLRGWVRKLGGLLRGFVTTRI